MEKITIQKPSSDSNENNFDDFGILITKDKELNGLVSDLIVSIKEQNLITEASLLNKLIVKKKKKKFNIKIICEKKGIKNTRVRDCLRRID